MGVEFLAAPHQADPQQIRWHDRGVYGLSSNNLASCAINTLGQFA